MNERQEIEHDCKHLSLRRSGGTTTKVRCLRNDKGIVTLELSYTQGLATDVFNNSKMFERRCSELCRMLCVAIKAVRDDGNVEPQANPNKVAAIGAGMVFFNIHKNIHGTLDQPVFGIKVDAHVVREDDVMAQVGFVARGLLNELHALDCAVPYARLVKAARHSRSFMPKPKHRPLNPFT